MFVRTSGKYLFSAKGAASTTAWGVAPGTGRIIHPSAESAIHSVRFLFG